MRNFGSGVSLSAARALLALTVALWVSFAPDAFASTRPYRGGAAAAAHATASEAAKEMLDRGGNAVDAAVAAAFTMGVVGPYHSGLGGGGFALVFDQKAQQTRVLDFRETAPKAATRDMFVKDGQVVPGLSTDGALSVAVPGAAKGYVELHRTYGKLPLKTVMAPAIKAAREGFLVTPRYTAIAHARRECLAADAEAARLFLVKGKEKDAEWQVPPVGHRVVQRDLAKTLQRISREGDKAFYAGPIAQAMVKTVRDGGGILSLEDLREYKTRWREPLEGQYRGHKVLTMPPPSAGGLAVVQVLAGLELLEPTASSYGDPEHHHRYAELVRRAYVDRARFLGDPAFVEVPMSKLTSRAHLEAMARSVDQSKATKSVELFDAGKASEGSTLKRPAPREAVPHPEGSPGGKNTTHISVVDRDGNAVSLTTTVNYGFGSCLVAKGTGVLLNDEMDDFSAQPMVPNAYGLVQGEANSVAPGKIPLSSMSPTLVFQKTREGEPERVMLAVGSPGGSTIPTTVIQIIRNVIDWQMDVQRAVGQGRLHHQYLPDVLMVDRFGVEAPTRRALQAKGHTLQDARGWGDPQAVYVDPVTGLRHAASDPTNEGAGAGQE